uniref:Rho termination factor N-terminal domain-containing protein n=1 Tax=Fluviicola sp. TaxID=1917219 RepID=UPI0026124CEF
MNKKDLDGKLLPELREIAKSLGVKKVESFKKNELIEQIQANAAPSEPTEKAPAKPKTTKKVAEPKTEQSALATDLFSSETPDNTEVKAEVKEAKPEAESNSNSHSKEKRKRIPAAKEATVTEAKAESTEAPKAEEAASAPEATTTSTEEKPVQERRPFE